MKPETIKSIIEVVIFLSILGIGYLAHVKSVSSYEKSLDSCNDYIKSHFYLLTDTNYEADREYVYVNIDDLNVSFIPNA